MSRLPVAVFVLLVVASAGAFFVVQHLKSTTPLLDGHPAPDPAAFNPRSGVVCQVNGRRIDFREMNISFYLLHRSDDVDVYMVDQSGAIVATLASGRHMVGSPHAVRVNFTWDGREDNGRFAPDGIYFVRVDLIHQGRTYVIGPQTGGPPSPVKIETHPPAPVVTSVTPGRIPAGARARVTIRYTGNEGHFGTVRIYRTDLPGGPRLVDTFETPGPGTPAVWDGTINHHPAPAGVYLVGLDVTDAACNTGRFPSRLPPAPGTTAHAGVSVRYVTAAGPLTPVAAGGRATVNVAADGAAYAWALRRPGSPAILRGGHATAASFTFDVPRSPAGIYELRVRAGPHATTLPIVVSALRPAPVLVVLPALTWQGLNPVDDTGDGLPSTLAAGDSVALARPLVNGRPSDVPGEEALIDALRRAHHAFDVTTDLGLITGVGPALAGHHGVILAGSERWITPVLAGALRTLVTNGGTVLSLGTDSLRTYARVAGGQARPAGTTTARDIFGIRHGLTGRGAVSVLEDQLGLFAGNSSGSFPGLTAYEPITSVGASGELLSGAGPDSSSLGVAGVRLGNGNVIEVGLDGFAARLSHNAQARALLTAAYALMTG